jgi:hypothetical protein
MWALDHDPAKLALAADRGVRGLHELDFRIRMSVPEPIHDGGVPQSPVNIDSLDVERRDLLRSSVHQFIVLGIYEPADRILAAARELAFPHVAACRLALGLAAGRDDVSEAASRELLADPKLDGKRADEIALVRSMLEDYNPNVKQRAEARIAALLGDGKR